MRALVVHESYFGCTRALAEAVADGVRAAVASAVVDVTPASTAPDDVRDLDLLVVAAPTHLLGLSSRASRWLQAQYWGAPGGRRRDHRPYGRPTVDASVRRWLGGVRCRPGLPGAACDTRVGGALPGHAAPAAARLLRARGVRLLARPEGFRVAGVAGPLLPGEADRARAWGESLVESLVELRASPPNRTPRAT